MSESASDTKREKRAKQRYNNILELVETNQTFRDNMQCLKEVRYEIDRHCTSHPNFLNIEEKRNLFHNVAALSRHAARFCDLLEAEAKKPLERISVSKVYETMLAPDGKKASYFDCMSIFVLETPLYDTQFKTLSEKYPKAGQWWQDVIVKKVNDFYKPGISALICSVFQFSTRIRTQMTEVLKHTEPDHFDYDDLLNICHKIEAALMSTNTEKGEMENNEKYYSYLALIDNLDRDLYSLMKPGQMIHEFDCGYSLSVENEGKQKGYNVKTNNKLIIINSAAFVLRPYQNSDNKRHYTALKVVRFNDVDIMFAVPEGTLHFVVLTKDREGDSDRFIVHFKDLKSRDKVLELFVEQLKIASKELTNPVVDLKPAELSKYFPGEYTAHKQMDTMSMRSDVSGLSRASSIAGKMDDKMDEAKHMISRMSRAIRSTRPSKFEYTKESKQKSRGSMSRASRRNSVRDEAALETSSELLWERAVEQSIAHRRGCGGNEDANTTTSSPDIVSQPKGARPLTVGTLPEAEWFCGQGSETIDMLGKGQAPRTPETGLCKSRSIRYVQQTRPATNESGAVQTQTKFVSRPGSQVEGSVDSRRVMTFPSWAQTEVDQQTADTLMIDQDQSLELTLEMQNFLFPETAAMERPIVKIIHANDLRELDVKLRNLVQKGGTTPKAHGGHMAPLNRIQNLRVPKKLAGGGVFDENKRLRSLSSPSPFTQEEPDEEISTSPATDSIANYKEVTDIINAANILDLSDSEPTPKVADGSIQRSTVKRGPKARPRPSHLQDDLRSASNGSMNSTSAMSDHVARSHSSASGAPVPNRPPPPKKLPAFVKAQQQEIESPTMLTKHEGIQSPDVQQRRPTRPANPPKRQITMRN